MRELYLHEFVQDVRDSTLSLWGGSMSVVLALIALILPDDWMKIITLFAAAACFTLGMYGAWLAKHEKVLEYAEAPLEISIPPSMGDPLTDPGSIYFHLFIKNPSKRPVADCMVYMVKIAKKIDGVWREERFLHQAPLTWQTTRFGPGDDKRCVVGVQVFDLGVILQPLMEFRPAFVQKTLKYGFLRRGETFRYYIRAEGLNGRMLKDKPAVVEVYWDGVYEPIPERIKHHFSCKPVDYDTAEREIVPA